MTVFRPVLLALCLVASLWQSSPLVTGLDHVIIVVDDVSKATADYRALGFAIKPGQPHANGIENAHVKFVDGTELELIHAPAAVDSLTATYVDHLKQGEGPVFAGLYASDRNRLSTDLSDAGYPMTTAGMLTTFASEGVLSYLFFGGRNQSPTDRPEHFAHLNGAQTLRGVWLATDGGQPRAILSRVGATFTAVSRQVPSAMVAERASFPSGEVLLLPARQRAAAGRPIVGVTLSVRSIGTVRDALARASSTVRNAVVWQGQSAYLPPTVTHGIWIEFAERD